ncbi:MAG: DMT family transporter [Betaproteobacteria bacterium]
MKRSQAIALMVLVTLLWSIAGVVTRHLDSARSFEVTFWRSLFNALTLIVALTCWRGWSLWSGIWRAGWAVWASGACWAVMYTAFMMAMTLTSVANVLVTMAVGPLLTALMARMALDHRLPQRTWLAIIVGGIGIAWMFARDTGTGLSLLGTLVAFAVPMAAAINWTMLQHASQSAARGEASPDMMPAVLIGALLSALLTLPLAAPLQASAHDIGLLALLGAIQLAAPCLLLVRVSRELPAPEIALLGLLEVVFGIALAWIGANETPSPAALTGGTLVLAALVANALAAPRQLREAGRVPLAGNPAQPIETGGA